MKYFGSVLLFFFKHLVPVGIGLFLSLFIIALFTYFYFAHNLVSPERIMNNNKTGIVLLDRNNTPFFTFYEGRVEKYVPLSQISPVMQEAVIAAEDKEFYEHPGFSIKGMLRALVLDIQEQKLAYGGSTITQQLVKNSLLNQEKDFLRKYQEIILSQEIERRYNKEKILEMYLNSVYFGEGAFGAEDAAKTYFGKSASDLTLAEASLLAGILPSPSKYDPLQGGLKEAKVRQDFVLTQMVDSGFITEKQKQEALQEKLAFSPVRNDMNQHAPHFALMVRDELIQKYGEERVLRSGFKVKTTLNLNWQKYAENSVANHVATLAPQNVSNGAAVVMEPTTGEVLALVGSKDWTNEDFGKFNIATAARQPGSSFKPIVYSAALEQRIITPSTVLHDVPTTFTGGYRPKDYDNKYRGNVLPRRALANSLNIPAVEVLAMLGVDNAVEQARKFGITTLSDPTNYGLSLVLGAGEVKLLELTGAYGVLANGGDKIPPTLILSITNKYDDTIYEYKPYSQRVLEPQVAYIISSFLSDKRTRAEAFGNALDIPYDAAVKTGTTENYKDAWTVGYMPNLVIGVWVGNNDGTPMSQIAGSLGAAPIWRDLMSTYLKELPTLAFPRPEGVTAVSICKYNGLLASNRSTSSASVEYYIAGTEPTQYCYVPKRNEDDKDEEKEKQDNENNSPNTPSDSEDEHRNEELRDEMRRQQREENRRLREQLRDILREEQAVP